MALIAGGVTVNSNGTHSGSGLALQLYEGKKAAHDAAAAEYGQTIELALLVNVRKFFARQSNEEAPRLISYLVGNIDVSVDVTTSNGALQRLPDPITVGADTIAPSAKRTILGTIL